MSWGGSMSFVAELKRRNVFRVAAAYAVVAWVFLQAADFLLELIEAPPWVLQVFFLAATIGFAAALIFAWVFELTPEGVRRESDIDRNESIAPQTGSKLDRVIIIFLALAVGGLLLERFMGSPETTPAITEEIAPSSETPADPALAEQTDSLSLAVLPFANMSADPDNEYFSDGISEELLNLLVKVDGLRVPSRTSSFAFKGQNMDIRDIAGQLEVGHVLEGSVRRADNRVRITAQLIDVSTDTHLWSETYDRELEDIFAIQDEIANEIVGALQLVLGTRVAHDRPTDNLEAYNLYLQGLYLFQQRESLLDAEQLLRQAVALDPEFTDAWAILGLTLVMQPPYTQRPLEEAIPLALEAADQADALRPDMAEALLVRANAAGKTGDYTTAMAIHQRAVELHPDHSLAQLWYAVQLLNVGYLIEAERHMLTARDLDPASGLILDWLGRTQFMLGKLEKGQANLERAIQLNREAAIWGLGILSLEGMLSSERLLELAGSSQFFEAMVQLSVPVNAGELDIEDALIRAHESAFNELARNFGQFVLSTLTGYSAGMVEFFPLIWPHDTSVINTLWYPGFGALRNDPSIKRELEQMGIVDVWRERGWPDLCRPLGDDDFECDP